MVKILRRNAFAAQNPNPAPARLEGGGSAESLEQLRPGQTGVVTGVEAESSLKLRLLELGFVPGSPVTFLMSTPFGDPNVYSLRGTSIALRKSEAQCILVRP